MKNFVTIIFGLIFTQSAFAQSTLKGTISDKDKHGPLNGATIFVPELNKVTNTNNAGAYLISGIGKGNFSIRISYLGYQTKIVEVSLHGRDTTLDIAMEPETIEVN